MVKLAAFQNLVIVYGFTLEGPKSELCRRGKRDSGRKRLKPNRENKTGCIALQQYAAFYPTVASKRKTLKRAK